MFEVARESNMRTAWCDKHLAYDILNGPSGKGIQDLFTPEINSDAPIFGSKVDWTSNNTLTRQYDGYKVSMRPLGSRNISLLILFFLLNIFLSSSIVSGIPPDPVSSSLLIVFDLLSSILSY